MTTLALHLPVLWYARQPVEPPVVLPAIAVSLLPMEATSTAWASTMVDAAKAQRDNARR
jgi:hypothetical protein